MTRHYIACHIAVMYACLSGAQCLQCSVQAIHPLQPSSIPAVLFAMQLCHHAWLTLGHFLRVHADDKQLTTEHCDSLTYRPSWTDDRQCIVHLQSVTYCSC